MDSRIERRARLTKPSPYLLFHPPANARVSAVVHNPADPPHIAWATGLWELDYGLRPTFSVQGVQQRQGNAIALDAQGSPTVGPPAVRESEFAYPYAWAPFVPAVQGSTVPRGKEEAAAVMVPQDVGPDVRDLRILRFRWRGTVAAAVVVGSGDGTVGPFTLDLTNGGLLGMPIVPGTVVITAPLVAGGNAVAGDWPWPRGEWQPECRYGRMIGDVDPSVDSIIDYETGQITITFSGPIVNAVGNIVGDYEHDYEHVPLDIFVSWDADSI